MQIGRLRYEQFNEGDTFVTLDHDSKVEFDEYDDRDTTLYLVALKTDGSEEKLITSVRLMPTIMDYDMEKDYWKHLLVGIELPREDHIYAGSRWYGLSHKTAEGRLGGGMLLQEMYRASQIFGFTTVYSFALSPCTNWMKKKNLETRDAGVTYETRPDGRDLKLNETLVSRELYELGVSQYNEALKALGTETEQSLAPETA